MITFTLKELAQLARLETRSEQAIAAVSTNSKEIGPQCLFVPLKGERFDGHDFIAGAVAQGAVAYVSSRPDETEAGAIKVACPNTLRLLGKCGQLVRRKSQALVCAITGSCGKTTVKEMTAAILSQCGPTLATQGNFNNDVGVPLTLLNLSAEHQYAVIEQGASHLLDIARTAEFVESDFALITNVGEAHIEGFGSREGVYQGKSELLTNLFARFPEPNGDGALPLGRGIGIVPGDSPWWPQWQQDFAQQLKQGRLLSFGESESATMRVSAVEQEGDKLSFTLSCTVPGLELNERITLNTLGRHNAINAAGAALLGRVMGASPAQIVAGLTASSNLTGRLTPHRFACGLTVIDDAYNASFNAVLAALDTLKQCPGFRVMVFGDMGELGDAALQLHYQVGEAACARVDAFLALGPLSQEAIAAIAACDAPAKVITNFSHSASHEELIPRLSATIKAELEQGHEVTCLVKGSHAMHMEKVVAALLELGAQLDQIRN